MSGIWTKQDQEWWDNKENQFIFKFNLLFTSGDYWERTPENVKPREEALRELYRKSCRHEPQVMLNFADTIKLIDGMIIQHKKGMEKHKEYGIVFNRHKDKLDILERLKVEIIKSKISA